MPRRRTLTLLCSASVALIATMTEPVHASTEFISRLPGLHAPGKIVRDDEGIPHIFATNEHDVIFLQGWAHARDRLFQMDVSRHQAEGRLAELLGRNALASDVQLRMFGLGRAAERSLPMLSRETRAALEAYAAGVNAYVASHPLPAEYTALELTTFEAWEPLDNLAISKLLTFSLSFDLSDIDRTTVLTRARQAGATRGFNGDTLFFQDTNRVEPFNPAATLPDALGAAQSSLPTAFAARATSAVAPVPFDAGALSTTVADLGEQYMQTLRDAPWALAATRIDNDDRGSNQFVIAGHRSVTGEPILANDPHLSLPTPSTYYENHLHAPGLDVIGASFAGTAFVSIGHNDRITWGATVNPVDVTDVYQERVLPDPGSPSGLSTMHDGVLEPIVALPQVYRVNNPADGVLDSLTVEPAGPSAPAQVLIVPRRSNGPILTLNLAAQTALSVQYTGFSGTREPDGSRGFARARNLQDFVAAVQNFDTGSQNYNYADTRGNIAWFESGELPLREDLDAGVVVGVPPYFVRNGESGNEWIAARSPNAQRSLPYEVLPFAEMPAVINPARGYIVNANNDPTGNTRDNDLLNERRPNGGIYYLSNGYDGGLRAGRIEELFTKLLATKPRLSPHDLQEIQADIVMGDAQFFSPHIVQALTNAQRPDAAPQLRTLAADPRVQEAVARLAAWDYSTPTGIVEGYDASDIDGVRTEPDATEIDNSVAATIYSVYRGQLLGQVLGLPLAARGLGVYSPRAEAFTAIKHLLETFDTNHGVGASGIDFFPVPGVALPQDRRDIVLLRTLANTLNLLAGPGFVDAFNRSTNQADYRWGKLHRITLAHQLGAPFSIPTAGGELPAPLAGLPGIPVDGGLFTVDAANHAAVGTTPAQFTFSGGPSRRFVARIQRIGRGVEATSSLPGGESGVLGSPYYFNLLPRWLTNDSFPLRQDILDLPGHIADFEVFVPERR